MFDLARTQHGLVARSQALSLGFSPSAIDRRVKLGYWEVALPGVYRVPGHPYGPEQRLMAAALWGGPGAAASHRAAAWALGLLDEARTPEIISSERRRGRTGLILHQRPQLLRSDVTRAKGIPVTNGTRTVLDCAAVLPARRAEAVMDRAIRLGLTSSEDLGSGLECLARQGRNGTVLGRALIEELNPGRAPAQSELESAFNGLVRTYGLPRPIAQFHVRRSDARDAYFDFAYPAQKIAIEVEGYAEHSGRGAFESDRRRYSDLVAQGWRILIFTWRQVIHEPEFVAHCVREALRTASV